MVEWRVKQKDLVLRALGVFFAISLLCGIAESSQAAESLSREHREAAEAECRQQAQGSSAVFAICLAELFSGLDLTRDVVDLSTVPKSARERAELACIGHNRRGLFAYDDCLRRQLGLEPVVRRMRGPPTAPRATAPAVPAVPPVERRTAPAPDVSPGGWPTIEASAVRGPYDPAALFARVARSVFVVLARDATVRPGSDKSGTQGSAVAVTPELFLTNCHVIKEAREIYLGNDRKFAEAQLVAADIQGDMCILSARGLDPDPVTAFRRYDSLTVGERVISVGTPSGFQNTLGEGIVSGMRTHEGLRYVQTTAPVSPGSSGGALFDADGRLIGVTTFVVEGGGLLNFAITAEEFLSVANKLR